MCKLKIFFENLTGGPYTYKELSTMVGIKRTRIAYYVWYHPEYKHFVKPEYENHYVNENDIKAVVDRFYTYDELSKILGVSRATVVRYIACHPEYRHLVRSRMDIKISNYLKNNPNFTDVDITNIAIKFNVNENYIRSLIKYGLLKFERKRQSLIRDYIKTLTSPKTYTEIGNDLGLSISAVSHFFARNPGCITENVRKEHRERPRKKYKSVYINKSRSQKRLNILKEFLDKLPNHSITISELSKCIGIHYRIIEKLLVYLPEYKCKIRDKGELYETDLVRFRNGIIDLKSTAKKIGKSVYTTRKRLIDSGCLCASKDMFYDGCDYSKDYYYK